MGANASTWACNYLSRAAGWLVAATAMIPPAAAQTTPVTGPVAGDGAAKMSLPGVYEGYSRRSYGVIKTSQYVPSFDGTLLAIDVYRPALNGKPAPGRFPVILENTRYQRSRSSPARGKTNFVEHGYVFVALDQRASGASFGTRRADYAPEENRDTKHVIEWLAMQPWSTGRVGMIGNSYKGITQFLAAGQSPKGLAALTPTVASFDAYNRTHPNGVWIPQDFVRAHTRPMDLGLAPHDGPLAVDDDIDGRALARAREEHRGNAYPPDYLVADMFRDSVDRRLGYAPGVESSGTTYLDTIAAQKLPIYQTAGWYDGAVTNQLGTRHLLGGRILIGPWTHWSIDQDLMGIEHLRWFDHVLKGVDNGVSSEPPIRYYTVGARPGTEWEFAPQWPLANTRMERLYFAGASTGTIASVNDGSLGGTPPVEATAHDTYRVDYGVTVFDGKYDKIARKWDGDMAPGVDKRGLTYTSAPLAGDKRVTGHPVLSLWLSADQPDAQLFAFLEDVSPDGVSRYVSDGVLRASHRAVDPAMEPWKSLGVPYHPSRSRDHAPIPEGEAVKLDFDLFATSYIFKAGHRVRLTILGALESFYRTPDSLRADPPPTLRVHRDAVRVSYLDLPVVENPQRVFRGSLSRVGATSDATAYLFASHLYLRGTDGGWQQWPLRAVPSGSGWICDTVGKGCSVQLRGDTLEVNLADAQFTGRKGSEISSD